MFTFTKILYMQMLSTRRYRLPFILIMVFILMASSSCSLFKKKEKDDLSILNRLQDMSDMAMVEVVVSKVVKVDDVPGWYKYGDRKLLISTRARIKAGIDMQALQPEAIEINGSSIRLILPPARIISINMDADSFKEEYARTDFFRSDFSNEERYDFLQQAEKEIIQSIPRMGVLEAADDSAQAFFEAWLRLMGFDQVVVVRDE